jgi:isocitrate lyase
VRLFEKEIAATERSFDSPRFAGSVRQYTARQLVERHGTVALEAAGAGGCERAGATERRRAVYRPDIDVVWCEMRCQDFAETRESWRVNRAKPQL